MNKLFIILPVAAAVCAAAAAGRVLAADEFDQLAPQSFRPLLQPLHGR
jgi:hypothetical protein